MSIYPTVRPSLTLDFQKSKQLDPRITFSRSSSATYVEGGVIKYADEHQARFEDDGLLIEESKTNAVLYSEDFQNQWSVGGGGSGGSATNSQTVSPDGNNTGAKFAAPATRYLNGTTTESGMPNTGVRFNLAAGTFDSVITGSPDSYDITPAGNGWYRCWLEVSNLTCSIYAKKGELDFIGIQLLNSSVFIYALNSTYNQTSTTDGIYLWGAQLEAGSFPTSYIPTSGSEEIRSVDIAQITGDNFSSWYNPSESTWYAEGDQLEIDSNGNQEARQSIFADRYANITPQRWSAQSWRGKQGSVAVLPVFAAPATPKGSTVKTTYAIDGTNAKMCVGGVLSNTGTLAAYFQNTELRLGKDSASGAPWVGHISRIAYYPERLNDEQLEAITS